MKLSTPLIALVLMALSAAVLFYAFERRLASAWFAFGVHPEVLATLDQTLEDQKTLARLNPEAGERYHDRFAATETLRQRLLILEHSRAGLVRRYELILLALFATTVALATTATLWRQSRRLIAHDRRRLRTLENLSAWQEAARRHAHEMRTPLTGARLELTRLQALAAQAGPTRSGELRQAAASAAQEIERLADFIRQLTSFARLPRPETVAQDLGRLLGEFTGTFAGAWPNLKLELEEREKGLAAAVDRDMLRQVLVNLADNAALALGEANGHLRLALSSAGEKLHLDVTDDGPGIDPAVHGRLFEPYTTTRAVGQGMGLGLAISKKILLDHDGDLELLKTGPEGTTFRLTLPRHIPEKRL